MTALEPRLASAVTELWQDKGMQEAYSRRNEFYISDSAGYFMSNVARFVDNDYLPTQGRKGLLFFWELPLMTSTKLLDFLTPSPLARNWN